MVDRSHARHARRPGRRRLAPRRPPGRAAAHRCSRSTASPRRRGPGRSSPRSSTGPVRGARPARPRPVQRPARALRHGRPRRGLCGGGRGRAATSRSSWSGTRWAASSPPSSPPRRPDLVRALVLVDGGLPFAAADEAATLTGLKPIEQRLQTSYTREEYRAGSATTPRSPATAPPRSRRTPTTTCPTTPGGRAWRRRWSRSTSSTCCGARPSPTPWSEQTPPAALPARRTRVRRRPAGAVPAADGRRLRPALARPRCPARAGRQPLHDRAQPPRRGGRGAGRRRPRLTLSPRRTSCCRGRSERRRVRPAGRGAPPAGTRPSRGRRSASSSTCRCRRRGSRPRAGCRARAG